ncbi:DNA-binding LacI/PurR family transcriptional regulator [Kribbella aluminosa]|uniref:DNA-binding LacI/PurR family transcriptional regulator n=2 Tax=Kribbella aluminosa TaxID=416017 RepID=A0ABS4UWM5_9ACTN|nr:DNA-binding LacI/PurR family transcriptional regulator [Kribbella aluminosa]
MAGVSQTMVSLVLNGRAASAGVTEETQKRVRDIIEELGYVPNVAARSLRGGRNGILGVHTFEPVFPVVLGDYYHDFLVGIEEQAIRMGQDLLLFASTQSEDGTRSIYGRGTNRLVLADGSVMLGMRTNDEELTRLAGEGYPFVFIGKRDVAGVAFPYVTADYEGATAGAVQLLHDHGHRRLGYLGLIHRIVPLDLRLRGFEHGMASLGADGTTPWLLDPTRLTSEWVADRLAEGITAFLVESIDLVDPFVAAVAGLGLEVPSDLSVVLLDVAPKDSVANGWSRIGLPRREQGPAERHAASAAARWRDLRRPFRDRRM